MMRTLLTAVLCVSFAVTAWAQEELNDDRVVEEREPGRQIMTEPTYKRLSAIHELMGTEGAEGVDNAEALKRAKALAETSRLNEYERALVLQTIGFLYANDNKLPEAIKYFEDSLALNALGSIEQQGMLYSLASLYASREQFRDAIRTAREWFRYEPDPKADAYILIGSSFAQLEDYRSALPYVKKAIQKADEKGKKPVESWHQLELAVYFETDQKPKAIPLLRKMIQLWPDKDTYWETLSGVHMELRQDRDALSTMMVAYHKGLMDDADQVLSLARLNMYLDIPYTAGVILAQEIDSGLVPRTKENLETLKSAWVASQEFDRGLEVMAELGRLTGDPTYSIDRAKIFNEKADWANTIAAAQESLEQGYDKPGEAYLLIGSAYAELGELNNAIKALRGAESEGTPDERRNARAWISFVQDRINSRVASAN
ncbi:MAG: hypothetical protein AAGF46_10525 [Pseudomonadota bacterium]